MAESNTQEKRKDLGNAREALEEFEGRMNVEVRRQEKLDIMEEKDFRREELPGKYTAKILDVKAKLDIVYFQYNQFSGQSVPNIMSSFQAVGSLTSSKVIPFK